jgi:hypothetical protein
MQQKKAFLSPSMSRCDEASMFLDIVDISWNPCCGYSCIIWLVDPSHRRGHTALLKSLLSCDIISSVTALLNGMKKKPLQIMYDWDVNQELLGLLKALFPNMEVTQKEKSRLML